jgi:hypothetical protein
VGLNSVVLAVIVGQDHNSNIANYHIRNSKFKCRGKIHTILDPCGSSFGRTVIQSLFSKQKEFCKMPLAMSDPMQEMYTIVNARPKCFE